MTNKLIADLGYVYKPILVHTNINKCAEICDITNRTRPIYNKNGVLLYERDSKLTMQGIISIKNFNLIGIYILEPAEPVPPMTADDLFFERFQTMEVFAIRDELSIIQKTGKLKSMPSIVLEIIKNYGKLDRRISFSQNLRSKSELVHNNTSQQRTAAHTKQPKALVVKA